MLQSARRNPLPYLLGLAIASNIGSTATIIGNPQNMLIGQVGRLAFDRFFFRVGVPVTLVSLAVLAAWIGSRSAIARPLTRAAFCAM